MPAVFLACQSGRAVPAQPKNVVDFHTHIGSEVQSIADQIFAASGVSVAVNLSAAPYGPRFEAAIARAAEAKTKILVFTGVNWRLAHAPDFGELAAEDLRRAVAAGARGLKISKVLGLRVPQVDGALMPVDTPALDPLWATAGALGVPVAIHTGDPVAFFEKPDPSNERWEELKDHPSWSFYGPGFPSLKALLAARDRMVARHPKTIFVAVHVGGLPEDLQQVAISMRKLPNLWIDIAARVPEIGRKDPNKVRAFFEEFQDRILFGTDLQISRYGLVLGSGGADEQHSADDAVAYYDVHWRYLQTHKRQMEHLTPIQGRWKIDAIGLGTKVLDKIYRGNARRLLGL